MPRDGTLLDDDRIISPTTRREQHLRTALDMLERSGDQNRWETCLWGTMRRHRVVRGGIDTEAVEGMARYLDVNYEYARFLVSKESRVRKRRLLERLLSEEMAQARVPHVTLFTRLLDALKRLPRSGRVAVPA